MVTLVPPGGPNWVFARDLLIDAFAAPIGDGDVHALLDDARPAFLVLRLSSPHGCAELRLDAAAVCRFVDRSRLIVERGAENVQADLTKFLNALRTTEPGSSPS